MVEHRLPEEELVCPSCGDTMTEIGKDVHRRLTLVPAKAVVVEDWYYTYACRNCEKENTETPVVKAAREPNFIPGSFATPEAAAPLMVQKFVMGSPLLPAEAGTETPRHSSVTADHVQLAAVVCGASTAACV